MPVLINNGRLDLFVCWALLKAVTSESGRRRSRAAHAILQRKNACFLQLNRCLARKWEERGAKSRKRHHHDLRDEQINDRLNQDEYPADIETHWNCPKEILWRTRQGVTDESITDLIPSGLFSTRYFLGRIGFDVFDDCFDFIQRKRCYLFLFFFGDLIIPQALFNIWSIGTPEQLYFFFFKYLDRSFFLGGPFFRYDRSSFLQADRIGIEFLTQ